ncbi:amidohydrolase family protein [Fundidesulfovibrio butyratiphilus]
MRLDFHTHVYHPAVAAKVLSAVTNYYGVKPTGTGLADDLEDCLDRAGLDGAVVHVAAKGPAQVIPANNLAIALDREHVQFHCFGTLHPRFANFEAELDRLERAGILGLKFVGGYQEFLLDDPGLMAILEAAVGRFVVLFHAGGQGGEPRKLAAIHKALPDLTMVCAHLGGVWQWDEAIEHLVGTGVYLDSSSVLHSITDEQLFAIWNGHPRERIFYGSDYPFFDPEREYVGLVQRLKPSDHDLINLLTGASRLLGLSR